MAEARLGPVWRRLGELARRKKVDDLPDAQLLDRFIAHRDERAFAALMQRYQRLVWRVCLNVLNNTAERIPDYNTRRE